MIQDVVVNDYFDWLVSLVGMERHSIRISYIKLLARLHDTKFKYTIPKDRNRADDGIDLRYRFADDYTDDPNVVRYLMGPCSVLEMMVALAVRCEENIMDDANVGDRTCQWFWGMISNLGLGSMSDDRFDRQYVDDTIARFLNREYDPDGAGGLFRVRNCDCDLRTVEIWYQLCWYLDNLI